MHYAIRDAIEQIVLKLRWNIIMVGLRGVHDMYLQFPKNLGVTDNKCYEAEFNKIQSADSKGQLCVQQDVLPVETEEVH